MQAYKWLTIFVACILLNCGNGSEQISGGSGTETINAFVCFSDGKPAKGAEIKIIDAEGWMDSVKNGSDGVLGLAVADSCGMVQIPLQDSNVHLNLQIDHSDEGVFVNLGKNGIHDMDTFKLSSYSAYNASFDSTVADVNEIALSGSAYRAQAAANGKFTFEKVAPSAFSVLGINHSAASRPMAMCGSVLLSAGKTISNKLTNSNFGRLLLDDFERDIAGPSCIGKLISSMVWYAVSDSVLMLWNENRKIMEFFPQEDSDLSHTHIALTSIENNDSRALRFDLTLDSNTSGNPPYAIAGISVSRQYENGMDLSQMKSISFKAQGMGTVWVRIEAKTLIDSTQSNFTYPIELTTTMKDYCIPVDSLRIMPNIANASKYQWSVESKKIMNIEFEFNTNVNRRGDSLYMIIDDMYIDNVGVDAVR